MPSKGEDGEEIEFLPYINRHKFVHEYFFRGQIVDKSPFVDKKRSEKPYFLRVKRHTVSMCVVNGNISTG